MDAVFILAGGAGSRLYPSSTDNMPKQFLQIFEGKSSFQSTLERFKFTKCYVVTIHKYKDIIMKQAKEVMVNIEIIYEPIRRNTFASCIFACLVAKHMELQNIIISPADHLTYNHNEYKDIANNPNNYKNTLSLIGAKAIYPDTNLGYISVNNKACFIEKPNLREAMDYIKNGYLWNTGIILSRVDVIFNLFQMHYTDILGLMKSRIYYKDYFYIDRYDGIPYISMDTAIIEKLSKINVIAIDMDWIDIGTKPTMLQAIANSFLCRNNA